MHEHDDAFTRGRSLTGASATGSPRSPQPAEIAALQAADREGLDAAKHPYLTKPRDRYVRAFLAGARHTEQQIRDVLTKWDALMRRSDGAVDAAYETCIEDLEAILRAGAADKDAVRPFQSCQCPAAPGEPCPLTLDECAARTDDYVGVPWFGARLRRIWDGFVNESLNGVVCSIPDSGLNTPPHRRWCVRCQRRYMELKALVEMLDRPPSTNAVDPQAQLPGTPSPRGRV